MSPLGALWLAVALLQPGAWRVAPARPTVGDTIWIERLVPATAGAIVRAAPWEAGGGPVEALSAPAVVREPGGRVRVRYAVVAWEPGAHRLEAPAVWRVAADGTSDSLPDATVTILVASVLPRDSTAPRGARQPMVRTARNPVPPAIGLLAALGTLGALWWWRRRKPREEPAASDTRVEALPPAASRVGDPRLDAARLAARLRAVIAAREEAAHPRLTDAECLAVLSERRPEWPLDELRQLLRRLETARFAPLVSHDATALVEESMALEARL